MLNTGDEIGPKQLAGCVRAFLDGKQTINWVMAFIRGHRLPKPILEAILASAQPNADPARYEELLSTCRDEGFL
ncbi:MAG: hypothetical protein KAU10_06060 [Dehalococcoidia bacterium]|nr:hypothetical protein [Dehalococcoidia bacterium]